MKPLALASTVLLLAACASGTTSLSTLPLTSPSAPLRVMPRPSAPTPGPVAPPSAAPSAPDPEPPPVAVGCDVPVPRPDMQCTETDLLCWQRARAAAQRYDDYQLRCAPLEPADPIAGERVSMMLAYPLDHGVGECTHEGMDIARSTQAGVTTFRVTLRVSGDCRSGAYGVPLADLGALDAGAYVVDAGEQRVAFTVRPATADPGPLPETLRVALEVASVHAPGNCFGMPGPDMDGMPMTPAFRETRTYLRMKRAYPQKTAEELEGWYRAAARIVIEPAGTNLFTYRYGDGQCCTIADVSGTVERTPGGGYAVGAPRVTNSRSVPC